MSRVALSSNAFSVDDQTADVLSWLSNSDNATHRNLMDRFVSAFPEYNSLIWGGAWVDTEASGVDPEFMSWARDWLEESGLVEWVEGEPYLVD